MRFKLIFILCLAFALVRCGNKPEQAGTPIPGVMDEPVVNWSFSNFTREIKVVSLPFETPCEADPAGSRFGIPDSVFAIYAPEDAREIYGLLADTESYTAILYLQPADIVLPVIRTSDKQGKVISDLPLFSKYCGEDEFSRGSATARINKDLSIELTDTVTFFNRDEDGEIIQSSQRQEISAKTYYIDDSGRIIERKGD